MIPLTMATILILIISTCPLGRGVVSLGQIDAVCALVRAHFGEEAALCEDGATLLAALGPVGDEALRTGSAAIEAVEALFSLRVVQDDDQQSSMFRSLRNSARQRPDLQAFSANEY